MVLEHSVASRFSSINAERILTFLYAHDIDINIYTRDAEQHTDEYERKQKNSFTFTPTRCMCSLIFINIYPLPHDARICVTIHARLVVDISIHYVVTHYTLQQSGVDEFFIQFFSSVFCSFFSFHYFESVCVSRALRFVQYFLSGLIKILRKFISFGIVAALRQLCTDIVIEKMCMTSH